MGDLGVLSLADVSGRVVRWSMGGLCYGRALHCCLVYERLSQRRYLHASAYSGLERSHAFGFFVVVWLLTEFQRSHEHLEQIVDARTAALRAEIDKRKRLEQAKLQAERLAMVGSMASRMAHEIRNPLGAISLNLDSVREELNTAASAGQFSGECQTLLREMRAQILRIHQVLQDYLRFGRMPSTQRADLSLNELLQEKLKFVQASLDEKGVELQTDFDSDLEPVQGDAEQLWEAFLNLIRNAVEAMNDGGRLTVRTNRNSPNAIISITDTGRGMSEDEAGRLFEPFFTTKSDGTALGLVHTQQVVLEHGGKSDARPR